MFIRLHGPGNDELLINADSIQIIVPLLDDEDCYVGSCIVFQNEAEINVMETINMIVQKMRDEGLRDG